MEDKKWLICGTCSDPDYPLVYGRYRLSGESLQVTGFPSLSIQRGTPALIASAVLAAQVLGITEPDALITFDDGKGHGSRNLYAKLVEILPSRRIELITYHYLFPDLDWHNKILMTTQELEHRPLQVADAGFMYVAKMSGYADQYDVFTPDAGEMAFLADEKAPHPFYTRGFLLAKEDDTPSLLQSCNLQNMAKTMIVKGKTDYIVHKGEILHSINSPNIEAMEAIGGTGDLITGLISALLVAGKPADQACYLAAKCNRLIGELANPNPASQIVELLYYIPKALSQILK